MDLKALTYFIETARRGNFSRAAATLGVTQSTISKMIRLIEDEIGSPLLDRDRRPAQLTDIGRIVYARGQEILAAHAGLMRDVARAQALDLGQLRLGLPPMINRLFTSVLKEYRERYPRIEVVLHEDTGQEVERQIANGQLDLGFSLMPIATGLALHAQRVARFRILAIGHPDLMRTLPPNPQVRHLQGRPLVLTSDDFALARLLDRQFEAAGITPYTIARSSQWDWTLSMAQAGMGIALLPEPFIDHPESQGLQTRPLGPPDLSWDVALLSPVAWSRLGHAAQAWVDLCEARIGGPWPRTETNSPS
ncbi:MAG: LysR family transcriptional regulator [Castellaniella sp.]|nr:LysR family transcriptional regulator [Castellaniella sp.]